FTVNKLVAFGDSVIFGACMGGPNVQADAYGDQKVVDLLGQEFGLKRYTSTDKIKSDNAEKWFYNSSMSGEITGGIKDRQVKAFDTELLAQADVVYMNGGTNDACSTMSKFLGGCGWGSTCADWTLEQTKQYIEDNSATMGKIAEMIRDNFIGIIEYIAGLDGFDGKIIIQNYPNQYAASENTNAEYLWDEFYERAVTSGQRAAIEATKDVYSDVCLFDVCSKVRNGAKYTGITYGDAQHLTFDGNRAIYKELSLMLNPDGANLLEFEPNDIPENAVWRTLYDFEKYNTGDTNIPGVLEDGRYNDVEIADMSETYPDGENPREGTNLSSTKVLKCNDNKQLNIDVSAYTKNAYGIRFKITAAAGAFKYWEYATQTESFIKQNLPMSTDSWKTVEMIAGYSGLSNWYSTIINVSDIQTLNAVKIWPNNGTCFYIDDVEILTTDEELPDVPDTPTAGPAPTTIAPTTTTPVAPDGYYDAAEATLSGGATTNTNHTGYMGKGFVDNFGAVGSAITFNVNVEEDGNYTLDFRYANACGDGKDAYPTLYIDGNKIQDLTFTENGKSGLANWAGWNYWSNNTEVSTDLTAGAHTIKIIYDTKSNSSNVDGLTLIKNGDTPIDTTVAPTTVEPTTAEPTTAEPTTAEPTTVEPTTAEPTTVEPTTAEPTTAEPTTVEPTTVAPTTVEPTTVEPTTTVTPIIYGDANGDGIVNLLDLIAMRKHLAKWTVEVDKQATD
ncbi:MAG: CBM35 domain-containing protein, partial [Acutalibacteraceae bacterium]